jgi:hypothetical protein
MGGLLHSIFSRRKKRKERRRRWTFFSSSHFCLLLRCSLPSYPKRWKDMVVAGLIRHTAHTAEERIL